MPSFDSLVYVQLYRNGMPNSQRGAPRGAKFPQHILLGVSNFPRVLHGGAINRGCQIPHDTGYLSYQCSRPDSEKVLPDASPTFAALDNIRCLLLRKLEGGNDSIEGGSF